MHPREATSEIPATPEPRVVPLYAATILMASSNPAGYLDGAAETCQWPALGGLRAKNPLIRY